jgi:hypothetical protein
MRLRPRSSSTYVAQRFGLRLALLLAVAGVQMAMGWDNPLVQLACLAAALCLVLATYNGERPTAAELTPWDKAGWFGLVACLG